MACEIAQLPVSGSGSAFSPLTLFECTITNAQMLIESMADRELLHALKIASGLHTHIVGIMEPRYDRACSRSDAHSACLMAAAAAASSSCSSVPSLQLVSLSKAENGASFSSASAALDSPAKQWTTNSIKEEQLPTEEDSIDDCLIMEEEGSFASGVGASVAGGSGSSRKRPRHDLGSTAAGAASTHGLSQDQASDCRNALRNSYKELKGTGPHLFNFALPFTDSVNQRVGEQVISHAQRQLSQVQLPQDTWWSNAHELFTFVKDDLHKNKLRIRKIRCKQKKLARRQKSFELLATSLSTDQFDKYRVLLSRDYTSSDEEAEDEGGVLRVRALTWESAEMKHMKHQLDEAFAEHCANPKQAQQLRRTVREPGCVSTRTAPADCPDWALAEEFKA